MPAKNDRKSPTSSVTVLLLLLEQLDVQVM